MGLQYARLGSTVATGMPEPQQDSPRTGLLDRLTKFFTSLAGAITAAVVLVGAIGGAVAYLNGGGDHKAANTGSPTHTAPPPPPPPPTSTSASLFSDRDSGPGGTTVRLSGEGFDGGERVVLRFHTEQIGTTTASSAGKFSNVAVTIPTSFSKFAPQQFSLIATGQSSARSAETPFTITG